VVPSIKTERVIGGSAETGVIVFVPVPIEKSIVFGPVVAFDAVMAARSDPDPESAVVVTLKVAA
jgi:hypothetical protein